MISEIFSDPNLVVVNKPSGISLLADRSGDTDLWTRLKSRYGKLYMLHRLDKGTSGVLAIARNQAIQRTLTAAFAQRQVDKHYLAVVAGQLFPGQTYTIELPLCRGRKSRYRVAGLRDNIALHGATYAVLPDREGLQSITRMRVMDCHETACVVALKPLTGRTHQLRVHLSWIGAPILGDSLYGPKDNAYSATRLMLHCHKLILPGYAAFVAPPPPEFSAWA